MIAGVATQANALTDLPLVHAYWARCRCV